MMPKYMFSVRGEPSYPADRADRALNFNQYRHRNNQPSKLPPVHLETPNERTYILRMPIQVQNSEVRVPEELKWVTPLLESTMSHQQNVIGINHPYIYITTRIGPVTSVNDDVWHVDGFSMKYNHLPEQNYLWVSGPNPTEYCVGGTMGMPEEFDPFVHNVHDLISSQIESSDLSVIETVDQETPYCFDPYVPHCRGSSGEGDFVDPSGSWRSMVRVSFVPIAIEDVNNTSNPLLPVSETSIDGVLDVRDKLVAL